MGLINRLAISGYRSLRNVVIDLGTLTVVTGANGSGKSSLYRALRLLSDVAQGRIIASLAAEGGLASTLWAGPEKFSREMKIGTRPVQGTVRAHSVTGRRRLSVVRMAPMRDHVRAGAGQFKSRVSGRGYLLRFLRRSSTRLSRRRDECRGDRVPADDAGV